MTRYSFRYITMAILCKLVSADGLEPSTHALKGVAVPKINDLQPMGRKNSE
jgi:hypothetical protein